MSATSKTDWFWSDWLGDQAVRRLTPAERGVWIDCLALMAAANPVGYLCDDRGRKLTHEEIARVVNATPIEVSNLLAAVLEKGAASLDRTGRIYNRRMVRKEQVAAKKRLTGKLGGAATRLKWQALQAVPQQKAWQTPRHAIGPPSQLRKKESTSVPVERGAEPNRSAGSLAPVEGALTRPPDTESVEKKRPSEATREDLEQLFAARRAKAS